MMVDFWVYLSHAFGKEAGFLLTFSKFNAGMQILKKKFAANYWFLASWNRPNINIDQQDWPGIYALLSLIAPAGPGIFQTFHFHIFYTDSPAGFSTNFYFQPILVIPSSTARKKIARSHLTENPQKTRIRLMTTVFYLIK